MSNPHEEPRIFKPGEVFRGLYDVEAFLGAGSAGQVYRVRHRFTGDQFALKAAHIKDRGNARKVARSLIEAKAGYQIRHRNVARVFDLAVEDDGMCWQVMELLDGVSIGELLARCGKLSPLYAIDIALEIAGGLQAAHEHQIIHRDVQPSNVFITAAGVVKVFDFSLAKVIPSGLDTTVGKHTMGTAAFMGPDALQHRAVPTPRFDVYALGMLLWYMLVGRHPFEDALGNEFTLVARQLKEDPESLVTAAGLPAYCDEVIRGATAKDPGQRYQGMWPFIRALTDLRARLVADLDAGRIFVEPSLHERRYPIQRDPDGHHQYNPPTSLPGQAPAPPLPSKRMVVAGGTPVAKHVVAATVPMAAFAMPAAAPVAAGTTASPVDVAAPTVRGGARRPARPRRPWALLLLALPVLAAVGVGVWLLVGGDGPAPAASSPSAAAPRASAPNASSAPRKPPPAPRTGR